jgi:F-type H+-transporting ATPase subunit delta
MTQAADFSSSLVSTKVDPVAQRVGVLYAKALFDSATKANKVDEVAADFEAVMQVLASHPTIVDMWRTSMIPNDEKARIFKTAFHGKAAELLVSFLQVVGKHGRAQFLRAIYLAFRDLNDERTGQVRIGLTSATKLDQATTDKLTEKLKQSLGRTPIFEPVVDPAVIGGVTLRIGDTVYDASIASQLEHLRTQMIDRSVHAIQSRRDSFRTATGN